jgi:hypothetical protein
MGEMRSLEFVASKRPVCCTESCLTLRPMPYRESRHARMLRQLPSWPQ